MVQQLGSQAAWCDAASPSPPFQTGAQTRRGAEAWATDPTFDPAPSAYPTQPFRGSPNPISLQYLPTPLFP